MRSYGCIYYNKMATYNYLLIKVKLKGSMDEDILKQIMEFKIKIHSH